MPHQPRVPTWQKIARSRLILLAGAGFFLLLLGALGREIAHRYAINREISGLEHQISELENKQSDLTKLLGYFQSPLFQEQEARRNLGLAKAGESVVIVPLEPSDQLTSQSSTTTTDERGTQRTLSNPRQWWNYFFSSS